MEIHQSQSNIEKPSNASLLKKLLLIIQKIRDSLSFTDTLLLQLIT